MQITRHLFISQKQLLRQRVKVDSVLIDHCKVCVCVFEYISLNH